MVRAIVSALLFAMAFANSSQTLAGSESCAGNYWPGTTPEHEVDSVSVRDLQRFLDTAPVFDGITFSATMNSDELWLDVVRYPGNVTALASIRTILVVGRVVQPEYSKLVLADAGGGVFEISYEAIHKIGCQFVWGSQGAGQNPIALNRDLIDNMRVYGTNERVAPPFNGSLLGDTGKMVNAFNEVVYPRWLLSNTEIE
jgi:hypothetical protein